MTRLGLDELVWELRTLLPNYRWNGRAVSVLLFSNTALARRSPNR
jgi:hypothetical protein